MRYFVEDTPTGFRFGFTSARMEVAFEQDGSHNALAEFYGRAERLFDENRRTMDVRRVRDRRKA